PITSRRKVFLFGWPETLCARSRPASAATSVNLTARGASSAREPSPARAARNVRRESALMQWWGGLPGPQPAPRPALGGTGIRISLVSNLLHRGPRSGRRASAARWQSTWLVEADAAWLWPSLQPRLDRVLQREDPLLHGWWEIHKHKVIFV